MSSFFACRQSEDAGKHGVRAYTVGFKERRNYAGSGI